MKHFYITVDQMDVRLSEWGDDDKPVIFCLHGLGSTSLSFIEIAEQLKEEFRIISVDAPGHGMTTPFSEPEQYEMPALARWLDEIVRLLDIGHFYFLSHSWGSFVALFYLKDYREKVLGSILIDGGYQTKRLSGISMEEEIEYYKKDFDQYKFDSWESFLQHEKSVYMRWSDLLEVAVKDLGRERDKEVYWHASGETAGHIIKGMHKHETVDIYDQLPTDLLLLRSTLPENREDDRKHTSYVFEQQTGGEVRRIPETSHLLHWDRPEVVVEAIRHKWL